MARKHIGHIRNTTLRRAALVAWLVFGTPVWVFYVAINAAAEGARVVAYEWRDFRRTVAGGFRRCWPRRNIDAGAG